MNMDYNTMRHSRDFNNSRSTPNEPVRWAQGLPLTEGGGFDCEWEGCEESASRGILVDGKRVWLCPEHDNEFEESKKHV